MAQIKWTRELIGERLVERQEKGMALTSTGIKKEDIRLYKAIERHFERLNDAKEFAGIPVTQQKKYTKAYIRKFLKELHEENKPMNPSHMWVNNKHFMRAVEREFGTYRNVIEELGIEYDSILVTDQTRATLGIEFEDTLEILFDRLGMEYTREPFIFQELHPDFRMENDRVWYEAKLMESTLGSDVVKKYEPHCETLNIVYLVGREGSRKYAGKENVNVMNVNELIGDDEKIKRLFDSLRRRVE